jgi:perosamine synthetase
MSELALFGGEPVSPRKITIAKPVFTDEEVRAVSEVLRSGYVRQGPITKQFEDAFKERVGAEYAYAVSSGTAALHTAFLSILEPGDEVIVPAFTFIATASTVIFSSGKPVFADIDEETFTIDLEDVKEKITSRTKAIAPVHLFGNAADIKGLLEIASDHKLYVVSDAAQAQGTMVDGMDVGSYDHLNCYSFYPTKVITTGEGGMVTTNDPELYRKGSLIRSHGQESKYLHTILGLNYRMTDIAAAIGLVQLSRLDFYLEKRRRNADFLIRGLKGIPGLRPQLVRRGVEHCYNYFAVVMDLDMFRCSRDEFMDALIAENIECQCHYPRSLVEQPVFKGLSSEDDCPVSRRVARSIFSIPVHPYLGEDDLGLIIEAIEKVANYYLKR